MTQPNLFEPFEPSEPAVPHEASAVGGSTPQSPPNAAARPPEPREATIAGILAAAPGWLVPLDVQAARILGDLGTPSDVGAPPDPTTDARIRLAIALASRQVRLGHVCLDIRRTAAEAGPADEEGGVIAGLFWPEAEAWVAALAASPLTVTLTDGAPPHAAPPLPAPLVLERPSARVYLRRWWTHEAVLAEALAARAAAGLEVDEAALGEGLARLFPAVEGAADVGRLDQAAAAALAVRRRLAVITGGPGTGKTTTVVRLLALLVEQALAAGTRPPRILLVAPTGKAAARLEASVAAARGDLPVTDAVRAAIPAEARTLHRALGPRLDGGWRHGPDDPLAADVVVVDEASMIDVALMRALVAATRDDARLVILGDRDQLASVEAGAVLADVCGTAGDESARGGPLRGGTRAGPSRRGEGGGLLRSSEGSGPPQGSPLPGGEQGDRGQTPVSDPVADSISAPISTPISDPVTDLATDPATDPADPPLSPHPPIAACIARLSFSFRFAAETGIGALARAVNAGEAPGWRAVFDNHAYLDVERIAAPPVDRAGRLEPRLQALAAAGYGVYLDALATLDADRDAIAGGQDGADHPPAGIAAALTALGAFRVLCAHRRGPAGVGALGAAIVAALAGAGRIAPAGEHWRGRPVMVTRNDDAQRLYNGDIGLIAPDPRAEGRLRAWFPGPDDVPRAVAPPRLPPHETVFAMSIHKSQGSEFDTVVVVLPDADSPILTRELLYTAITRARKKVVIFGTDAVVDAAVMRRAERASGLRQRLWGTE